MKRYLFLFFGILFFLLHFIYSPLVCGTLKKVKDEIENLFLSFKIYREKIIINKKGNEYFILSAGFNFDKKYAKFIFGMNKNYYVYESKNNVYFCIFNNKKFTFLNEENLEELYKLITSISNFILFVGVRGDLSSFWEEKMENIFKIINARENLKDKYGYSYIFIVKKENGRFFPIYEKICKDRAIYLEIKF